MTPEQVQELFTRSDGAYVFARWGRPVAPMVIGIQDQTLAVIKGALETAAAIARHEIVEVDPELGANLMVFFLADWSDLLTVGHMAELIPDLPDKVQMLTERQAHQYRTFRFDDADAIKACFNFVCLSGPLAEVPADVVGLSLAVQAMLLWSDRAFTQASPLAQSPAGAVIEPGIANLLRAAYDPLLPSATRDPAHGLRLFARSQMPGEGQT